MSVSTTLLYSSQGVLENSSLAKVWRRWSLISSRNESRSKPDLVVNSCCFIVEEAFLLALFLAVLLPAFFVGEVVFFALFIILDVSEHIL